MNFKSLFALSRTQRLASIFLFSIILVLQTVILTADFSPKMFVQDQSWLALQPRIDSMRNLKAEPVVKHYPFNPNFISDYRGHVLGMTVEQIDRLHTFRAKGKFVNSAKEFQQVTGISDSLLLALIPYFKFPDWVNKRNQSSSDKLTVAARPMMDINTASKNDLEKVYGIGDKLSDRILEQREKLGGFVSIEQMNDVWGLSPEVVANLKKGFHVSKIPEVKKIAINEVSLKELAQFPYFRYALAKKIVTWRSMNGNFENVEDLSKVEGFPFEKKDIIAVYLEF